MFKKKEKADDRFRLNRLTLYDAEMKVLFSDSIDRMSLPESLVLANSEEIFNDPDPCEIHRWAIARWLFDEMLGELPQGKVVPVPELSPHFAMCCREYTPAFACLNTEPERSARP